MIRIAVTPAAFDAIVRSLPLGSVAYEPDVNAKGEREIWLAPRGDGPPDPRAAAERKLQHHQAGGDEENLMPDNGYRYTIDRCDVPEERRPALKRFREKRLEWLSWLYKDMHHAVWPTLHTMVWMDV